MMQLVMTVRGGGAPKLEGIAQWVRWPCGRRFEHIVRRKGEDIRRWLAGPEYEAWMNAYAGNLEDRDRRMPSGCLAETEPQNVIPVWTS